MKATFRKITEADNQAVARIIHTVMPEFGASGPGFAIHDEEVHRMFESYSKPRCAYFVCVVNGQLLGGAGLAPLAGGAEDTCELKKMYLLSHARAKGYGKQLLKIGIAEARALRFDKMYLETFHTMSAAITLYESLGFRKLPGSLGNTGHFACDNFFLLDLRESL